MTDDAIITSIKQNGGWCQLHHPNSVALINVLGGRLVFHNKELAFIEKFDLPTDSLKGFIVVVDGTRQKLKKANWIKKILSVGGKVINDSNLPDTIFAKTLHDFLQKLKSSAELHILRLTDKELKGRIIDFSDSDLIFDIGSNPDNSIKVKIGFPQVVCFELRTSKIKQPN